MPNAFGGMFPTQYRSAPVHPDRAIVQRGQPSFASAPGQLGAPRSDEGRKKKGDPKRTPKDRIKLSKHDQYLSTAKNESMEKSATMKTIVAKIKGGFNPVGRQYRLVKTTPGSAGTNMVNPMTMQKPRLTPK